MGRKKYFFIIIADIVFSEKELKDVRNSLIKLEKEKLYSQHRLKKNKGANLEGADLTRANLRNTNLSEANLKNSNLTETFLHGANLVNTDLKNARLLYADITNSIFEPNNLDLFNLLGVKGLPSIQVSNITLVNKWRKDANSQKLRSIERDCISILKKYQLNLENSNLDWILQAIILGGFVTDYAANSSGILLFLFSLVFVFSIIYFYLINKSNEEFSVVMITADNQKMTICLEDNKYIILFLWAFYFSLLSAFHIGRGDIQIGSWLPRIQQKEYILKGTGIIRTISGIQSLISAYLIIVLIVTYFENPFA